MPPMVAAAIVTGIAGAGTAAIGARSQSQSNQRAISAQERAAAKAEAFEREQDAENRADDARRDAEDKRRWDTEQANLMAQQAERDARQQYEDQIRYRKMVNIARLTGQAPPPPLPTYGSGQAPMTIGALGKAPVSGPMSAPIMSAPSRTNAMIAAPDPMFDPLSTQRVPLSKLAGRRY